MGLNCGERLEVFSHGGGRREAEKMQVPFLGEVPLDIRVRQGGDDGRPPVSHDPESVPALAFKEIAEKLAALISVQTWRKFEPQAAVNP